MLLAYTRTLGRAFFGSGSLSGTIPTEIGTYTRLTFLSIYNQNLDGPIPTEIGNLSLLANIKLGDRNDLTGPIPTEIGRLTRLTNFGIKNNLHSGPLPTELGRLTLISAGNLYALPLQRAHSHSLPPSLRTKLLPPPCYPLNPALLHFGRSDIFGNAGFCGPRIALGGTITSYSISDTAIGSACPYPWVPTASPTTSTPTTSPSTTAPTPTPPPCCTELQANPLFTCMQTQFPSMAATLCDSGC
jgi:hypothetical protein